MAYALLAAVVIGLCVSKLSGNDFAAVEAGFALWATLMSIDSMARDVVLALKDRKDTDVDLDQPRE